MPLPAVYNKPVIRPGFVTSATWLDDPTANDVAQLELQYTKEDGSTGAVILQVGGDYPERNLCLPSSATINDLDEDLLIAHLRMAAFVSGSLPGSQEFRDTYMDEGTGEVANKQWLQTPLGEVRITNVVIVSDVLVDITFRKGTSGPTRTVRASMSEFITYTFTPSTQLLVYGGHVKWAHSTYIHDTGDRLSSTEANTIASEALTWDPWV